MSPFETYFVQVAVALTVAGIVGLIASRKALLSWYRKRRLLASSGPHKGDWFERQKRPTLAELKSRADRRDGRNQ